jgi:hypothetical protein
MEAIKVADMRGMTMEVEISTTRGFAIRKAIALFLIRLAARVMRCGIDVHETKE